MDEIEGRSEDIRDSPPLHPHQAPLVVGGHRYMPPPALP